MSRYIDADVLKDDLIHNRCFYPAIVDSAIRNTPTADVVEVRRGEWVEDVRKGDQTVRIPFVPPGDGAYCSLCGEYAPAGQLGDSMPSDFCPNCGAKMDGERREG